MADINIIREQYASMNNDEIIGLIKDSDSLTHEAFIALKQEFKKRTIDPSILEEQEAGLIENKKQSIRDNFEKKHKNFIKEIYKYALDQKFENVPDEEIQKGLMQKQLTGEEALYVTQSLEQTATELLKDADATRLSALVRLLCGLAVIVIAFVASLKSEVYALGLIIAVISIFQTAIASNRKRLYQAILTNIKLEKENENLQSEVVDI